MEQKHTNETRNGSFITRTYPDDSPESPRTWDNLGTMVCFHSRYELGDDHNFQSDDFCGWEEFKTELIKNHKAEIILPLYLYDHSGITIATTPFSCRWDSGQVGFIYITREKILEELGGTTLTELRRELTTSYLENEVKTYDQYLIGDVYGYKVFRLAECNHGHIHEEELDACWGYFGEESCMEDGISMMNSYIQSEISGVRKTNLTLLDSGIELNEECIPNQNLTYKVFFSEEKKMFLCELEQEEGSANLGRVSIEDAPKVLLYKLNKDLCQFTEEEKSNILEYRGLNLVENGFELMDVFMEKSFITLIGYSV